MEKKLNKILVSVLAVILITTLTVGVTYAYLVAHDSQNITVKSASGINSVLTLTTVKETSNMVPIMDNKIVTAIKNNCVDKNNYDVCSLYSVKLTNTSKDNNPKAESLYGYVRTVSSSYTTTNLRYQIFDSSYNAVTDVMTISNSSGGFVYFEKSSSKLTVTSNGTKNYYFVIWLTDTGAEQSSDYSKVFNGAIGFELVGSISDTSNRIEANF